MSGRRAGRGAEAGAGKRRREFVIVIARRGRAAIAITARHRSYRRVGLLRPVRIFRRIHSSSLHFAWPTRIFALLHGHAPAKHPVFSKNMGSISISIPMDRFNLGEFRDRKKKKDHRLEIERIDIVLDKIWR